MSPTPPALSNPVRWHGTPENGRVARLHADGTLVPAWPNWRSEQRAQEQVNRAFAAMMSASTGTCAWCKRTSGATRFRDLPVCLPCVTPASRGKPPLGNPPAWLEGSPASGLDADLAAYHADGTASWDIRPVDVLDADEVRPMPVAVAEAAREHLFAAPVRPLMGVPPVVERTEWSTSEPPVYGKQACDPEMHKVNGFCGVCCDGNL